MAAEEMAEEGSAAAEAGREQVALEAEPEVVGMMAAAVMEVAATEMVHVAMAQVAMAVVEMVVVVTVAGAAEMVVAM